MKPDPYIFYTSNKVVICAFPSGPTTNEMNETNILMAYVVIADSARFIKIFCSKKLFTLC